MNDREKKIAYLGLGLIGMLIALCITVLAVKSHNEKKRTDEAESAAYESHVADLAQNHGDPVGDAESRQDLLSGEYAGDDRIVRSYDEPLDLDYEAGDERRFAYLAATYNKCIPYITNGIDESLYNGYTRGTKVDNSGLGEYAHGMTNQGYIVWLYRNVYGKAPEALRDFDRLCKNAEYVTKDNLKPGDIGMIHNEGADGNVFGVYIGVYDGKHMFTCCRTVPTRDIPMGTNHISYLKSENDRYFCGSPAVDFGYFVRVR